MEVCIYIYIHILSISIDLSRSIYVYLVYFHIIDHRVLLLHMLLPGTAGSSTTVLAGRESADCSEAIRALAAWDLLGFTSLTQAKLSGNAEIRVCIIKVRGSGLMFRMGDADKGLRFCLQVPHLTLHLPSVAPWRALQRDSHRTTGVRPYSST